MRVLVIEDATNTPSLGMTLAAHHFSVEETGEGEEGVSLAKLYDFDVILLDMSLKADITGLETLRQIRRAGIKTPVIVLADKQAQVLYDCVRLLAAGADDYMTKPFDNRELLARICALVRRSKGLAQSTISTGNLTINLDVRRAYVDDCPLALTGKEYQMLELLSLRKGVTLSKEVFLTHLYGGMDEPEQKIIDVFICKLRAKLRAVNGHQIETVWGRGYVLRDADTKSPSMAAEVGDMIDNPPVHVSKMSFAEYDAMKGGQKSKRDKRLDFVGA